MTERVIQVAVHVLRRDGSSGFKPVQGNSSLKLSETVQRVVVELHSLYSGRASKAHGRFAENTDDYPTRRFLEAFVVGVSRISTP